MDDIENLTKQLTEHFESTIKCPTVQYPQSKLQICDEDSKVYVVERMLSDYGRFTSTTHHQRESLFPPAFLRVSEIPADRYSPDAKGLYSPYRIQSKVAYEDTDDTWISAISDPMEQQQQLSVFYKILGARGVSVFAPNQTKRTTDESSYHQLDTEHKIMKLGGFYDGATYFGEWNRLGFSGRGVYRYPHGVIYDGHFNGEGEFHGIGTLIYPCGKKIEGIWKKGKLVDMMAGDENYNIEFDGLEDRRFTIEKETGLRGVGQEMISSEEPPKILDRDCYDVGFGTYNAYTRYIVLAEPLDTNSERPKKSDNKIYDKMKDYDFEEETKKLIESLKRKDEDNFLVEGGHKVAEIPIENADSWIKNECRTFDDKPVGYQPELFEVFTSGAESQLHEIEHKRIPKAPQNKYPAAERKPVPNMFTNFVSKEKQRPRKLTDEKSAVRKYFRLKLMESLI